MKYVLMNQHANNCCGEQDGREWAKCLNEEVTFVNVLETKDMKGFVLGLNPEDEIIVAGGDGTLHHFANDVAEIEVKKLAGLSPDAPLPEGSDKWEVRLFNNAPNQPFLTVPFLKK